METQAARHDERLPSLREIGVAKLRALGRALELREGVIRSAVEIFDQMSAPWSDLSVGDRPPWPNDITDDGTPFEFSVALDGKGCELRMLLESQSLPITAISSWEAGLAMQRKLASVGLVDLERFERVADLFAPDVSAPPRFSLWHAAVVREGRAPLVKAYLNPRVRGAGNAGGLVEQALSRLGLDSAWRHLQQAAGPGGDLDMRYFALDLDASGSARVKIYVASSEPAPHIERLLKGVGNFRPGQATEFLTRLTGDSGPFPARPVLCCFAFVTGQAVPLSTLHVPVRCYVDDDSQALERAAMLLPSGVSLPLARAIHSFASRPLSVGRGLITYTSLTPSERGLRVTAYLAPEAYAISAPRQISHAGTRDPDSPLRPGPSAGQDKLAGARWHIAKQTESLSHHPLLATIGTLDAHGAEQLAARVAALALFVKDGLRAAQARFALPATQASEVDHGFELRVTNLIALLSERGGLAAREGLWPFLHEHESLRDWAYAQVATLFGLNDDLSRLAAIWCLRSMVGALVAAVLDGLLRHRMPLSSRSAEGHGGFESGLVPVARSERMSEPPLLAAVGSLQHPCIDRISTDVLRLASALERMLRELASSSDATLLDRPRMNG